jgi:hypothetical protein
MIFAWVIALSVSVGLPQAKAAQYTFYATDTATQNDDGITVYYGDSGDWMMIRTVPSSQGGNGFIKFDLSEIPDGSVITGATLYLGLNSMHNPPGDVGIYYGPNDNWSINQLNNPIGFDPNLHVGNFYIKSGGWEFIPIALDLGVYDFQSDINDNALTLAIIVDDNLSDPGLYFYLWGANDLIWRPYLMIDVVPAPLNPIPDIKANGLDGPLYITQGDPLSVTVELNAAGNSDNADWWILADTPIGWYRYNVPDDTWEPGQTVTYQGPLFDLSPYEVLNMSGLPLGSYTFYFGVDTNMNGLIDMGQLYYDSVDVNIYHPTSTPLRY